MRKIFRINLVDATWVVIEIAAVVILGYFVFSLITSPPKPNYGVKFFARDQAGHAVTWWEYVHVDGPKACLDRARDLAAKSDLPVQDFDCVSTD